MELQLAEQYLTQMSGLAQPNTEVLLPLDLSRLQDLLAGVELGGTFAKSAEDHGEAPSGFAGLPQPRPRS